MITIQYYNETNTARIFKGSEYVADLKRDGYEELTLSEVTDLLDDFGIRKINWTETGYGWQCKLNTLEVA